jgi:hypothetical protein
MRIGEQLVGIVPVAKIRNSQQLFKKIYTQKQTYNKFTYNNTLNIII